VVATRLFGLRRGAVAVIVGVAAYTLLAGVGASVVRAAIMGSLALTARQIGCRAQGLNGLALAAWGTTVFNPQWLWDVGFQLSAAATVGLVLYAESFEAAFKAFVARFISSERSERVVTLAGELVRLTLAAQITTLPLVAYYFKSVFLIALAANLLILPAQPALMILAGLALVLGLIALSLGQLAAYLALPFSAYTLNLVQAIARAPVAWTCS
jgi:competence protein ComEC